MNIETIFGKTLKRFRERANLSQEEVAFNAGLHPTYISLLERGKTNPSLKIIFALATVLNVQPSELVKVVELQFEKQYH